MSDEINIRRFYTEEYNPEVHESTAALEILDVCDDCYAQAELNYDFYGEEKMTPPYMACDICEVEQE